MADSLATPRLHPTATPTPIASEQLNLPLDSYYCADTMDDSLYSAVSIFTIIRNRDS